MNIFNTIKSATVSVLLAAISMTSAAFTIDTSPSGGNPMNAMWWNANESGWGVSTVQQRDVIFATMYTYDANGNATWYVVSSCNVSRDSCTGDLFSVAGGVAPTLPWNAAVVVPAKVGTFTATFTDANTATFTYSINGVNGSKPVTRFLWGPQQPPAATLSWQKPADLNTGMPTGIEVFRGEGNGLRAVAATLDSAANNAVEWNVVSIAPGSKTPLEFAQSESKKSYVTINGGYFGASSINQSFSLIVKNGTLAAPGVKQLTRSGSIYFPTRAAFGAMPNGDVMATWAYPVGAANTIYRFALPSPNDSAKPPKQAPDATFPAGGQTWAPAKAIGGGPMLILNGSKTITFVEEVFDAASGINATGAAPRTAIARLKDNKVMLIVVDGRSSASRGVTLNELADILLSLGATDAINLDGGGSSAMVVNNALANVPSDGVQRSIPSVVMFRDK